MDKEQVRTNINKLESEMASLVNGDRGNRISPEMQKVLLGALYIARDQYKKDAAVAGIDGENPLSEQFEKQQYECEILIDCLD